MNTHNRICALPGCNLPAEQTGGRRFCSHAHRDAAEAIPGEPCPFPGCGRPTTLARGKFCSVEHCREYRRSLAAARRRHAEQVAAIGIRPNVTRPVYTRDDIIAAFEAVKPAPPGTVIRCSRHRRRPTPERPLPEHPSWWNDGR